MYTTGKIPDDFKKSIMLMLPKKSKSTKCEEHQTLSILTHTSKILTKIILGRIEKKIDENLAEDQFDFRKNRGTREAILCLRTIVEKIFEHLREIVAHMQGTYVDSLRQLSVPCKCSIPACMKYGCKW